DQVRDGMGVYEGGRIQTCVGLDRAQVLESVTRYEADDSVRLCDPAAAHGFVEAGDRCRSGRLGIDSLPASKVALSLPDRFVGNRNGPTAGFVNRLESERSIDVERHDQPADARGRFERTDGPFTTTPGRVNSGVSGRLHAVNLGHPVDPPLAIKPREATPDSSQKAASTDRNQDVIRSRAELLDDLRADCAQLVHRVGTVAEGRNDEAKVLSASQALEVFIDLGCLPRVAAVSVDPVDPRA